jgi:hypothetical protein
MVFIEAPIFSKHIYDYLDDKSYSALQQALALRPEAGKKSLVVVACERYVGQGLVVENVEGSVSFTTGYEKMDKYGY